MTTYTAASGVVQLGQRIGAGGEGAVFEVIGRPDVVAKVYHGQISKVRQDKLMAMQALVTPRLAALTAWPSEVLRSHGGTISGFLMPRITSGKDIHKLYSPKSRLSEFPTADWRMLVRAALNTSRAFAALHESGCLVADVNHGGITVASDATVKLIDCDSFQVTQGGRTFLCEVGVDTFTPPELQGVAFGQTVRTTNHDNFGLAVLIFQMLLMGRHPFAGRYRGPEDMPIPKAIGQFRYAYARDTASTGMQVPPGTAPVLTASAPIAAFWEQAFGRSGVAPGGRPTAQQWVHALSAIDGKFAKCARNPSHFFLSGQSTCPWCPIEQIGVALFGVSSATIQANGAFNIEAIWAQIKAIPSLGATPAVPAVANVKPSQAATEVGTRRSFWRTAGVLVGLAIFILGNVLNSDLMIVWIALSIVIGTATFKRGSAEISTFQERERRARTALDDIASRWRRELDTGAFEKKRQTMDSLRQEWTQLPALRQKRYADLVANREKNALITFLDAFEIEDATISGVGAAKKATLESYGIETAADVVWNKVMEVPGFGPALTQRLLDWRRKVESRFRFDPKSGVDPRHIADLDRVIATRRGEIENELRLGAPALQAIRANFEARRRALEGTLQAALAEYAQAKSDLTAVS